MNYYSVLTAWAKGRSIRLEGVILKQILKLCLYTVGREVLEFVATEGCEANSNGRAKEGLDGFMDTRFRNGC